MKIGSFRIMHDVYLMISDIDDKIINIYDMRLLSKKTLFIDMDIDKKCICFWCVDDQQILFDADFSLFPIIEAFMLANIEK